VGSNGNAELYRLAVELRVSLRRFMTHSDRTVRKAGLTPLQYLLLLAVKGAESGRESTMSELGGVLQLAQSSVTELVDRAEAAGLVERGGTDDRRVVTVSATPEGERRLDAAFRAIHDEREELLEHLDFARRRFEESPA
jgi:DNA-binding MarR family transcriptional regulator